MLRLKSAFLLFMSISSLFFFTLFINSCEEKENPPVLSVSKSILDFSDNLDELTFTISNSEANSIIPLEWQINISNNLYWYSFSKMSGSLSSQLESKITIKLDRSATPMNLDGDSFIISSNSGDFEVNMKGEIKPIFSYSLSQISINEKDTSRVITVINNLKKNNEKYTISISQNLEEYIKISKSEGEVFSEDSILVFFSPYNYTGSPKKINGTILVSPNSNSIGDKEIKLTLTINEFIDLRVQPNSLIFDSEIKSIELVLSNRGTVGLSYEVKNIPDWITVDEVTGNLPLNDRNKVINVKPNRLGFKYQIFNEDIIIDYGDESKKVHVEFDNQPAKTKVEPSGFNFEIDDESQFVTLTNLSSVIAEYQIEVEDDWVLIGDLSGFIESNDNKLIEIDVDRIGLQSGTYNSKISIQMNDKDNPITTVNITMIIPPPLLEVTTTVLNLSHNIKDRTFSIKNAGGGFLDWQIVDNGKPTTIDISITNGTINIEPEELNVSVDRKIIKIDNYQYDIEITSNGGNQTVTLQYEKRFNEPTTDLVKYFPIAECEDFDLRDGDNHFYYGARLSKNLVKLNGNEVVGLTNLSGLGDCYGGEGFAWDKDNKHFYMGGTRSISKVNSETMQAVACLKGDIYNNNFTFDDLSETDNHVFALYSFKATIYKFVKYNGGLVYEEDIWIKNLIDDGNRIVGYLNMSNGLDYSGYVLTTHVYAGGEDYSQIIKIGYKSGQLSVIERYNLRTDINPTGITYNPNNDQIYISTKGEIFMMGENYLK